MCSRPITTSATRDRHPSDPLNLAQTVRNLLRNLPRRLLQPLRQFKTYWRSCLSHLNLWRPLQNDRQLHAIFLADVPSQRLAQSLRQSLVHGSPFFSKAIEYRGLAQPNTSLPEPHFSTRVRVSFLNCIFSFKFFLTFITPVVHYLRSNKSQEKLEGENAI